MAAVCILFSKFESVCMSVVPTPRGVRGELPSLSLHNGFDICDVYVMFHVLRIKVIFLDTPGVLFCMIFTTFLL